MQWFVANKFTSRLRFLLFEARIFTSVIILVFLRDGRRLQRPLRLSFTKHHFHFFSSVRYFPFFVLKIPPPADSTPSSWVLLPLSSPLPSLYIHSPHLVVAFSTPPLLMNAPRCRSWTWRLALGEWVPFPSLHSFSARSVSWSIITVVRSCRPLSAGHRRCEFARADRREPLQKRRPVVVAELYWLTAESARRWPLVVGGWWVGGRAYSKVKGRIN